MIYKILFCCSSDFKKEFKRKIYIRDKLFLGALYSLRFNLVTHALRDIAQPSRPLQ